MLQAQPPESDRRNAAGTTPTPRAGLHVARDARRRHETRPVEDPGPLPGCRRQEKHDARARKRAARGRGHGSPQALGDRFASVGDGHRDGRGRDRRQRRAARPRPVRTCSHDARGQARDRHQRRRSHDDPRRGLGASLHAARHARRRVSAAAGTRPELAADADRRARARTADRRHLFFDFRPTTRGHI